MKTIHIAASHSYDAIIGHNLLSICGLTIQEHCPGGICAIVSDDIVYSLYGNLVTQSLLDAGLTSVSFVFPAGEDGKNCENYIRLLDFLAQHQFSRADAIIALGGGVSGDLAGFAAATYLRGINFIQLPTTLLAMVDSSVGGKTGINMSLGKNMIGAFYQPSAVLCSIDTLSTLPENQFRAGCAEIIKYAILEGQEFFDELLQFGTSFDRETVIAQCISCKQKWVAADEYDTGCRQFLNLGHTVGHAIETLSNFSICHGEAVAIGLSVITRASAAAGLCCTDCSKNVDALLLRFGLPLKCPFNAETLSKAIAFDKKRRGNHITLVLPQAIGQCILYTMPANQLGEFVKAGIL